MKILIFILAVTVLACSIIPCREFAFAAKVHEHSKILKSSGEQDHRDSDNCSPFCSCNCCCGITFLYTTYQVAQPIAVVIPKHIIDLPGEISDTALPVWQPPQLV